MSGGNEATQPAVAAGPGGAAAPAPPAVAFTDHADPGLTQVELTWPAGEDHPPLATVVDMFTRLGVEVVDHDRPHPGAFGSGAPRRDLYLLRLPAVPGVIGNEKAPRNALAGLFAAVWTGQAELDGFTRLAMTAAVPWREVAVIRALWRFLHQTGVGLSHGYAERTVLAKPAFAHALLAYFRARFDPDLPDGERAAEVAQAAARIDTLLADAASLDEDRILRGLRDVLTAVLRTNFYQRDAAGNPRAALALKISSRGLGLLAPPRPWVEVFVLAPTVEGVHLRGGRVARGGLRFSDRPEDYRTEVHGLFRAQVTKNVVIVPDGAKGAFVLRDPGATTRPGPERVRAAYRLFVSSLLDVTDNLVGGKPAGPARTICYDGPDPYLVVAADKGTATFSDLANAIAEERGYWLGDAFASGGSVGYDHKEMGITARGAWESTRRHLRELGIDPDTDAFTAVGIGDMSGDVFGNGMLLSASMRLVAAFDHRHVFVDPDPDPALSYAQRRRLFERPGSSWADYDPAALSPGGAVFRRDARAVNLSARAREVLGLPPAAEGDAPLSPVELIRAVLRAPVDLLYNGGIGTYVKASAESQDDAEDHANDAVRVNADEVRARAVVEGGNLGLTQAARVEFARHGGRVNTDFLDNSAGVDTSDHEVNLKILLAGAVDDGELTLAERDELLRSLTDDIAADVLSDSQAQAAAVSLASAYAPYYLDRHIRVLRNLEARAGLDRALEHLPSEARLEELRAARSGLTRPEIAVLQAKAKTLVRHELLESALPDEPAVDQVAQHYFPLPVRRRFSARISAHPLVREIIATELANELVNRMGPGFVFRLEEQHGVTTADVARAFTATSQIFGIYPIWAALDAQGGGLPAADELAARRAVREFLELATDWLLRNARGRSGTAVAVDRLRPDAEALTGAFGVTGPSRSLADRVAGLGVLGTALDLLLCEPRPGPAPIADAARVHEALGEHLALTALYDRLDDVVADSHFTLAAKATLRAQLTELWAELDWLVLDEGPGEDARQAAQAWLGRHADAVGPFSAVLAEVAGHPPVVAPRPATDVGPIRVGPMDIAAATVALGELRVLAQRAQFGETGVGPRLREL